MKEFLEQLQQPHHQYTGTCSQKFMLDKYKLSLLNHIGEGVVYTSTDRKHTPILCTIHQVYPYHVVLESTLYYPNGLYRGKMYISVSYSNLHCETERVVFLDE